MAFSKRVKGAVVLMKFNIQQMPQHDINNDKECILILSCYILS